MQFAIGRGFENLFETGQVSWTFWNILMKFGMHIDVDNP